MHECIFCGITHKLRLRREQSNSVFCSSPAVVVDKAAEAKKAAKAEEVKKANAADDKAAQKAAREKQKAAADAAIAVARENKAAEMQ
jgi:hypothetical protein